MAGTLEVFSVNALGALVLMTGKVIAGAGVSTVVGLVSVNVKVLVALNEVLGKFNGEALEGKSVTGPLAD